MMDKEFKRLILRLLVAILMVTLSIAEHDPLKNDDKGKIVDLMEEIREYGRQLG